MTNHLKILDYLSKNKGEEGFIPIDNFLTKIGITNQEYKYEILNHLRFRGYALFSDGLPYDIFGNGNSNATPIFTAKLELDGIEHLHEFKLRNRDIILTNRSVQVAVVSAIITIASLGYTVYQNNISNKKDEELKKLRSINKQQSTELQKANAVIAGIKMTKQSLAIQHRKDSTVVGAKPGRHQIDMKGGRNSAGVPKKNLN